MIILNKKKILSVIGLIIMFVFTYIVTSFNINNANEKSVKAIETVALPVNNKVIIIDARAWRTR